MDISYLPKLEPLTTRYAEGYAAYKTNSDEYEKIFEWISDRFDEDITSKLTNTDLKDHGSTTLSVLGIGSGDGLIEIKLLVRLMKKFRLIECTVVEPSAERIASYKKRVEEQKDALSSVTFKWRQETLQEFCKSNTDGIKKFHFVSAIHSLHFVAKEDLDFYLNTLCGWTKGKILIILGSETGCFDRLQRKFKGSLFASTPIIRGSNITESLARLGIKFESRVLPSECDITNCFESDSRDGKVFLDFLLKVVGCVDDGPPELVKMIQEFLKAEGISYMKNGRLFAGIPTHVTIAST